MRFFGLILFGVLSLVAANPLEDVLQLRDESNCRTLMDLFLILDSSGSIGSVAFGQAKSALIDLVSKLQIAPKKVQVWVINYGEIVETPIAFHNMPLSEFTKENLINKIKTIRYMDGSCTATGDALAEARRICGKFCRGLQEGVSRVALVLTDGNSNCGAAVGVESTNFAHITKASVFAVGIGYAINNAELLSIASDRKYMMHVTNYLELTTIINNITVQTCGIPAFVIPNVKVESEVPSNTYRYYQLDTSDFVRDNRSAQGGYVEILANVHQGQIEVYTSTTNQNPKYGSAKRVQFQTRGSDQYYIEYIDQEVPKLYFSFFGLQANNEYDFTVRWLDIQAGMIG